MSGVTPLFVRVNGMPPLKSPSVVGWNETLEVLVAIAGGSALAGADVAARPATGPPRATAPASAHAALFQDPMCIMNRHPPLVRGTTSARLGAAPYPRTTHQKGSSSARVCSE